VATAIPSSTNGAGPAANRVRNRKDGGSVWHFDGGASVGVRIGNRAYPAGSYILHGRFTLVIQPDKTREFRHVHAEMENLCQTLA
jgi:hypothetical protein